VTRLVLLPGLGTTGRLFDPQRQAFPALEIPPWLEPEPAETVPAYGKRMAATLGPAGPDLVLGGVSFGGMVAFEMARHVPARVVVLIASGTSPRTLTRMAGGLARAGRRLPPRALPPPRPLWPAVAWGFGARTAEERALVYELIRTSRPGFAKWGLGALIDWQTSGPEPCPVRRIHGVEDRLIGAARVPAEIVIPGAGHLINVTHAADVNAFIRAALDGVVLRESGPRERARVCAFYVASGHSGLVGPVDRVLIAEAGGEIVGAVRLCVEEGAQVLRTMRVRPDFQRRGIGRLLLRRFATMLDGRDCFCIPYAHLAGFYGDIGFEAVPPDALPPHLATRLAGYRARTPNVAVIGMRRRP
jgi:pimeloyl-ACP methyl ester carboxylesterase/N-acetylglutamate synthase-like GNAT family acetyltransferase